MNLGHTQRGKVFRQRGTITTCGRWAEFYRFPNFRISDASSESDSNNLLTSSAGEPVVLQVGKDLCGHRFFRVENRIGGKAANSNRDQGITLENMQHCHAGLVRTEDGFITKTVDMSRFAAIGGQHGKHCLSKMRWSVLHRIENVEIDPSIAFDRSITPLRLIVAASAVLVVALGVLDRHAQNFLDIRFRDDFWEIDFVASHYGAHAAANNDQNSEADHFSSHKILWVKSRRSMTESQRHINLSIVNDRRIALCDEASNI